ncbi:MAG: CaiB/BaiF CoA transferase family protein [bacterium]|jgi:crotonobetainyl-CoA:carnitine CoA-transferase CaiB-like acyl-CoA transferase|nr:CoA transferase [Betaproteobacteria bacterium]
MALPLEGVKVVDLTNVLAGPFCTMTMSDLGAEVLKVENFPEGDLSRRLSPKINDESYCFAMVNRNKRSIGLDLKSPRGKEVFMKLAAGADVILENMRPDAKFHMGVDYESVKKVNEKIIYASISGFGQTGPYAKKGGYDIVAQGMTGIMRMTGDQGGRPAKVGIAMNDVAGGITALYAILAAYIHRLRTGEGQYLETSLVDAGLAWMMWESAAFFGAGEVAMANGTRHRRSAPYQAFRTADGYVTVGANSEKMWASFCNDVLGRPEMLQDERFEGLQNRLANVDALQDEIEKVLTTQPTAHWVPLLDKAAVPGGPVYTFDETVEDPHIKAREMFFDVEHPIIGKMKNIGYPVKFSRTPQQFRSAAPWLGQHTTDVLGELGYTAAQIESLFGDSVVFDKYRKPA